MPPRKKLSPTAVVGLDFAVALARVADDNRCEDVLILDLRNISGIADFFVIVTGTSDRQLRAVADRMDEYAETVGQQRFGISGYENSTWILADYVDVVIHLFDAERRRYYDLELLWGDAPRIEWRESVTA